MKISELIAKLTEIEAEHGDAEIRVGIEGIHVSKLVKIETWNNIISSDHMLECHILGSEKS